MSYISFLLLSLPPIAVSPQIHSISTFYYVGSNNNISMVVLSAKNRLQPVVTGDGGGEEEEEEPRQQQQNHDMCTGRSPSTDRFTLEPRVDALKFITRRGSPLLSHFSSILRLAPKLRKLCVVVFIVKNRNLGDRKLIY